MLLFSLLFHPVFDSTMIIRKQTQTLAVIFLN